ncbi:alginate O-acetyltransferase [Pseudomonas sp. HR96]|uniref:alginate O-acetyltransferase n=1 Tax=Pseudomonas sp. HR96 TaxID=1027966 RepID=UPI002A75ACBB|nr:alginate O-acetyltransferase [Pseudomonas sp. HR96]WPP00739.1 alginate O-acetyltransferase [Pseudomonas sp. HR96]
MTRSLRILYVGAFLAILVGLGLWSLSGLAGFQRSAQMTLLDGHFTQAVQTRYDEQFPIKRLGTNLWAAVEYLLFNEGRPGVVLGRDHWLYSDEEFNPVADGQRYAAENFALIRGVRDTLAQHHVQLVLAIVPAKARLYPEHIGQQPPAALHAQLYQQFHARAQQAGILAPELLAPLQQAKADGAVFLRTDTHWTPLGAEVVARQLSQAIAAHDPLAGAPQTYVTDSQAAAPYKGDLTTFLPLDPLFGNLLPPPDDLAQRSTHLQQAAEASADALFASDDIAVALVGTSYSANPHWNFLGALQQALHSDVINYAENGHGPILPMLKYLQGEAFKNSPPQVLIWEFPERYLPMKNDFSEFDPKWIAELKRPSAGNQDLALGQND